MVKRRKTTVQIIKPNLDKNEKQADNSKTVELIKKVVREEIVKAGYVISRLDYPVSFKYNDIEVSLSPRQKMKFANIDLVNDLPAGVAKVKI